MYKNGIEKKTPNFAQCKFLLIQNRVLFHWHFKSNNPLTNQLTEINASVWNWSCHYMYCNVVLLFLCIETHDNERLNHKGADNFYFIVIMHWTLFQHRNNFRLESRLLLDFSICVVFYFYSLRKACVNCKKYKFLIKFLK